MLPKSADRVTDATSDDVNRRIAAGTEARLRWYAAHPDEIGRRLSELDAEWDTERTLQANAATIAFMGVALGALHHRRWLALPAVVTGFLLQHALQGWCPPLPVIRRLGVRTVREIETERAALKALRGDFAAVGSRSDTPEEAARYALKAVRA